MTDELSYDAIELNKNCGPYKYPLSDRLPRILEAIENKHPWHHGRSPWGPSVAPPTVLGNASLRFIDTIYGPVPPGTLHAKQDIDTDAALRVDRQPIGYGRFIEKYERRGRRWFVFEARWRDETGLILGHTRTTMAFPEKLQMPDDDESSARAEQKQAARQGEIASVARTVTEEKLRAYTEDSANSQRGKSIHTDAEVARAAGFATMVAQGMMAADYISEAMANTLGSAWYADAKLSLAFLRPILNGDTITACGRLDREEEDGAVVRKTYAVWAKNEQGDIVADGKATSLVMPDIASRTRNAPQNE
jgi:acyl dehydratase